MKKELLIVDGYNVIGSWPHLNQLKLKDQLPEARDQLLWDLSEYQKYSGKKIIVVFDAMYVPGNARTVQVKNINVVWTSKNETADSYIETLATKEQSLFTQVEVATSDHAEQWTIFSAGALRIPAPELLRSVRRAKVEIKQVTKTYHQRPLGNRINFNETEAQKLRDLYQRLNQDQ
ncbi:NYN domain-containing protein [Fructilactobacillus cliffordii]|uniref:NYN domain-containing protein n=1 Tax=Fructilactobacillus cliffordii TaxID=2940299 RepID=A0A9Q9E2M9_9LACO|nr:NYN domain-containing protein [Fructilactobacillus cliffordii]USS88733.1 NYN domain-containing protein [Fructilactobacillus cliffordii]